MAEIEDRRPVDRRKAGLVLVLAALAVTAIVAINRWGASEDDAEYDHAVARLERAIHIDNGRPDLAADIDLDPAPDRSQVWLTLGLGGAAVIAGFALMVSAKE